MKRLFWTLLFLISASIISMIVGCAGPHKRKELHILNVDSLPNIDYSIYIIDSCEYIVFHNGNATWGSHKGNCKNPKHDN